MPTSNKPTPRKSTAKAANRKSAASTVKYLNPWHTQHGTDPAQYETAVRGVVCGPYVVYERLAGVCWDWVIDGVCVAQRAGFSRRIPTGPFGLPRPINKARAYAANLLAEFKARGNGVRR